MSDNDRTVETMERWAREYGQEGVFEINLAGERILVICNWEVMQPVLALRPFKVTRFSVYGRLGLVHAMQALFFVEGRQWSLHRRLVAPTFNARAVETYVPAVSGLVGSVVGKVSEAAAADAPLNVSVLMRNFNADVISKVAFGTDFGALHMPSKDLADVYLILNSMVRRLVSPFPYWRVPGLARLLGDEGNPALDRLRSTVKRLLADPGSHTGATLLAKLAEAEGDKLSHEELVGLVVVLFISGTDSMTHALVWVFYHLARDTQLQDAVASEVRALPSATPVGAALDSLVTTQAVWLETLRLKTSTFLDLEAAEPFTLQGRVVPAKTMMWALIREAARTSPEAQAALGTDLQEFRPSRWFAPGGGLVRCPPFDALPFGHGPRACVAQHLVNALGPLMVAEVLRRFQIDQWEGAPLREKSGFVLSPHRDVELRFRIRAAATC